MGQALDTLVQEAWDELKDQGDLAEVSDAVVTEVARGVVPVMTTTLFQLVVDDNEIGFLDVEDSADTPFAALFAAVSDEVATRLFARMEADDDD